jgi:hypothetical protein
MRAMPYLQIGNGKYRVRIVVPPELRPYLPPPHTGKANLTRAFGTGNERGVNRLAVAWIADFQAAITTAFRPARRVRPLLPVHFSRTGRRGAALGPDRGDVLRPDLRDRHRRRGVGAAPSPIHQVLLNSAQDYEAAAEPTDSGITVAEHACCVFATRCRHKLEPLCDTTSSPFRALSATHAIACHLDTLQGTWYWASSSARSPNA